MGRIKEIVFALPGNELLAAHIAASTGAERGSCEFAQFPDGETYVRILSPVSAKRAILVCTLAQPDTKIIALFFLASALRDSKISKITLVAPYLAYMRQDKQFKEGEAVTSRYFARLISGMIDEIVTVDPHTHRNRSLSEIYSISTTVVHAAPLVAAYIAANVAAPLIVGPDEESEQWVAEVARMAGADHIILKKKRISASEVQIEFPVRKIPAGTTPVLVDDMISTAGTMIESIALFGKLNEVKPVCVAVHPVFSGDAFKRLASAGVKEIATCNTINHSSNRIDVSPLIIRAIENE